MDFCWSVPGLGWGWWRLHSRIAHFKKGGDKDGFLLVSLDTLQPDLSSPTLGHILLFRYHISASNLLSMPLSFPSPTLDLFGGGAIQGSSLPVSAPRVPRFTWVWVFWLDGIRAERRVWGTNGEGREAERRTVLGPGCWAVVCVAEAVTVRLTTGEDWALEREAGVCLHHLGVKNKCSWGWRWLVVWR